MSFYVRKQLATGPIRFGVSPRVDPHPAETGSGFSTGPAGEFRRRGSAPMVFSEYRSGEAVPTITQSAAMQRLSALSLRSKVIMAAGFLIFLLGIAVFMKRGLPGIIEMIIGVAMIATPLILSEKRRREIKAQEERERAARAEEEAKNRALMGSLAEKLEAIPQKCDAGEIDRLRQELEQRGIAYEVWSPMARKAAIRSAFLSLSNFDKVGAAGVGSEVEYICHVVGLSHDDAVGVKADLYRSALWHLAVDDRLQHRQDTALEELRRALHLGEEVEPDEAAAEEFRKLRRVGPHSMPSKEVSLPLRFQEVCYHHTSGEIVKPKTAKVKMPNGSTRIEQQWAPVRACQIYITSKRLILDGDKRLELPLAEVFDQEVDADRRVLTIVTSNKKKPHHLIVDDPFYTAAVLSSAAELTQKPVIR